ncbi:MAG: histidine phosphatase family protein [Candidatus Krumholzibacteria bacterium]|nr:histidine phosphatase family protein [Candidatus Krumholzibacteria bacterium]
MLLYLIRHGRTDWNVDRRVMGHTAVPLNGEGRGQVAELARSLRAKKISAIYTSTVERALETARILAAEWQAELREEPRLNESTFDGWVGMTYHDLRDDVDFKRYFEAPGRSHFSAREGMIDIQRRALEAVSRIAGEIGAGRAAAVSHSDVIKPILVHYLGMDLDAMHRLSIANASATLLDFEEEPPRVRCVNFAPWQWRVAP